MSKKSKTKVDSNPIAEEKLTLNFGGSNIQTSVTLSVAETLNLLNIVNNYLNKQVQTVEEPSTN